MKRRTVVFVIAVGATAILGAVLGLMASSRTQAFQAAAMEGRDAAAAAVDSLASNDATAAIAKFDDAAASFGAASELLGPDWAKSAISAVPWIGAQFRAADDLTMVGLGGSTAGKELATIMRDVSSTPAGETRLSALLKTARPHLDAALVSLTTVADHYARLPDQGLLPPLADAVRSAKQVVGPLDPILRRSDSFLALERYFLATPRRILIVSQNNAELRPTGGFIGSYGLIEIGPDGLALKEYKDVYTLKDSPRRVPAPAGATMAGTYLQFRDANWWIDFPTSARTLLQFWQDLEQPAVDGVVAVDVVAMGELLNVFGPITVKEFDTTFTAENLLERLTYIVEVQMAPTGRARKGVLSLLANELSHRMMAMKPDDLLATSTALGKSANEKHVQLYFTDSDTQSAMKEGGWAGAIDPPDDTTDLLAVTNAMIRAAKANAGVRKTIDYQVRLATDGSADTTLTLGYYNDEAHLRGTWRAWFGNYLRVYRPVGTQQLTGPGEAAAAGLMTDEIGLPAVTRAFRVHRGDSREEVIRTSVPHALAPGRASVVPRSPLAAGTGTQPLMPASSVSHYRLLVVRQVDLENVPTRISVSLPAGWPVSGVSAWNRTTGEALLVSNHDGAIELSTPLNGDVIVDVETVRG